MKRKAVERKPGMRHRSQSQLEAELAAAIVRRIEKRIRSAQQVDVVRPGPSESEGERR